MRFMLTLQTSLSQGSAFLTSAAVGRVLFVGPPLVPERSRSLSAFHCADEGAASERLHLLVLLLLLPQHCE